MAKYSHKMMGKEVGQASTYAEPHTMKGKKIGSKDAMKAVTAPPDPNKLTADQLKAGIPAQRVSGGDPNADTTKTSGIKVRGTGAATKGLMARGPMA